MPKLTSVQRASRAPLAEATTTPPQTLPPTQKICRVLRAVGNNNFTVTAPTPPTNPSSPSETKKTLLVQLPAHYRNLVWLRNGGYVVIDTDGPNVEKDRKNKLDGEIVNVVREERVWRKMGYWPEEFRKEDVAEEESDEEEGRNPNRRVGEMPPSDDDDEEEEEEE